MHHTHKYVHDNNGFYKFTVVSKMKELNNP